MRDQLLRLAQQAEAAVAAAGGVIDDDELEPMRKTIENLRQRLAFPEEVAVAVLAGGTGSGKSSIFNVLVGADVAEVGGVRPTTSRPVAAVPEALGQTLDGLLSRIGVEERHVYSGSLCVIDLPDYDSVKQANRQVVDEILPLVDVVVWVLDPEKYRDARVHHDYLSALNAYSKQFIFVINQIDRLDHVATVEVVRDLGVALEEDGIEDAEVVAVSAAPPTGPPAGVDELVTAIRSKTEERAGMAKLVTDLALVGSDLSTRLGSGLDFDERANDAVSDAIGFVLSNDVAASTAGLVSFVDYIGDEAGGPVGLEIQRQAVEIPRHMSRIIDEVSPDPVRGRFGRVKASRGPDPDLMRMKLAAEVIRPVRALLAKRAVAVAAIAEFVVAAQPITGLSDD